MKQTSGPTKKPPAEAVLKDIRRATRRYFSAEEKIRIVLEGLRGEEHSGPRWSALRGAEPDPARPAVAATVLPEIRHD